LADQQLTGILLVGGASARFGSPKAFARFKGETLAERAWRLLEEVCDERVAVGHSGGLPFSALADEPTVDPERFADGHWQHAPTSFERLQQRDAIRCVEETIGNLPSQQRRVITLRDVCGLPATEVCDLLSLTAENQRVLLHRARAKVCAALERLQLGEGAAPFAPAAPAISASGAGGRP